MSLPIHELAGLTEAEIKLAIEERLEIREAAMDIKLNQHRDEIGKRLDRTEDTVNGTATRLSDLQADVAVLSEANSRQTTMLETLVTQGESWHASDLEYRADVLSRVGKLEAGQVTLTTEVKRLRWVGYFFLGIGTSTRYIYGKLCEFGLWKLVITGLFLWALHLLSPVFYDLAMKLAEK